MYTTTMTEQEVVNEYMRDWQYISRTYARWLHPDTQKLAAEARKHKIQSITRLSCIRTPNHNRAYVIKTVNIKFGYVDVLPIGIVECSDGVVMHILLMGGCEIAFFTSHFFHRYKERMEQGGIHMKDAVRTFFKRNPVIVPSSGAHPKYENSIQISCDDGMMLGNFRGFITIDGEKRQMIDIRTFLRKGDKVSQRIQFIDNENRRKL